MQIKIILQSHITYLANKKIKRKKYARPGIWALHGRMPSGKWKCLEVSQTPNVYRDVKRAIYMLTVSDEKRCERHFRFFDGIKFQKNMLSRIYKYNNTIKPNYDEFRFICVNISDSMCGLEDRLDAAEEYEVAQNASAWFGW